MPVSLDYLTHLRYSGAQELYIMNVVLMEGTTEIARRTWEHPNPEVVERLARVFILSTTAAHYQTTTPERVVDKEAGLIQPPLPF